ncbi:MAG: hypothetical protein V4526_00600 [Patescibacteria group bacterium]
MKVTNLKAVATATGWKLTFTPLAAPTATPPATAAPHKYTLYLSENADWLNSWQAADAGLRSQSVTEVARATSSGEFNVRWTKGPFFATVVPVNPATGAEEEAETIRVDEHPQNVARKKKIRNTFLWAAGVAVLIIAAVIGAWYLYTEVIKPRSARKQIAINQAANTPYTADASVASDIADSRAANDARMDRIEAALQALIRPPAPAAQIPTDRGQQVLAPQGSLGSFGTSPHQETPATGVRHRTIAHPPRTENGRTFYPVTEQVEVTSEISTPAVGAQGNVGTVPSGSGGLSGRVDHYHHFDPVQGNVAGNLGIAPRQPATTRQPAVAPNAPTATQRPNIVRMRNEPALIRIEPGQEVRVWKASNRELHFRPETYNNPDLQIMAETSTGEIVPVENLAVMQGSTDNRVSAPWAVFKNNGRSVQTVHITYTDKYQ